MNPDYSARKRGLPTMPITERIKRNITINPITKCWEWNGSKRRGYGRMIVGSRTNGTRRSESAHRVSYELYHGEIPAGMEVCHTCDNPCCVNPEHLFVGTRQDNLQNVASAFWLALGVYALHLLRKWDKNFNELYEELIKEE